MTARTFHAVGIIASLAVMVLAAYAAEPLGVAGFALAAAWAYAGMPEADQ